MRKLIATTLLAGLLSSTAMADNNESATWSKVGPWQIRVDPSLGQSCFMMAGYPGSGTILRVGFDNRANNAYILFGNPAWKTLEAGKLYQITAQFDVGISAEWNAKAVNMGGVAYLVVYFRDSPYEVLQTFGQPLNLKLSYHGTLLDNLRLNGTAAAAAETINCNRQFQATKTDPFGNGGTPAPEGHPVSNNDPFARDF